MKNLMTCLIVAALVSTANAGFKISVNGVVDPCDSDTWLMPSDTAVLGIVGDGGTQSPAPSCLLVQGPGSVECGSGPWFQSDGWPNCEDCEDLWDDPSHTCPPPELVDMFPGLADFVWLLLSDFPPTLPPPPLVGLLVDDIIFHCEGDADVTITLLNEDFSVVYDTRIIHQGPPPGPKTYNVDTADGNDTNDGLTRQTAFATIQKGIDDANDYDTVLVWPGLYNESVDFKGRAITLKSAADAAIIEAPGADAVTFHGGEGSGSVLKNFVIRNSGLAISLNYGSSPTISNLTIVDNDFGIAAYENSNPDISNCIFANNRNGDLFGCTARYSCVAGQPGEEPIEGLVSHWKFDEGAGSVAYDSAGSNHGTIHGAQWTAGLFDGALDFDGYVDYVQIPDDDSLTPPTQITVAWWIYNRGGQPAGIFKWASCPWGSPSPGNSRAYGLFISDTDKKVYFTVHSDVHNWDIVGGDRELSLNQWHHVATTFDKGTASIYVDGQLDKSEVMSVSYIMNDAQPLIIGGAWGYCDGSPSFDNRLNGIADDVRIYNRALTEEEIQQLYEGVVDEPVVHDPVASWKFDEGVGSIAYDSAGDNHGTIHGAQWTAGMAGGALDFDGFGDYVRVSDPTSLDLDTRYTVSAWIKTDTISAKNAIIVAYRDRVTPSVLFQLDRYGADMRFVVVDEAANTLVALYPGALLANSWYHVAGVRDGDSLKVFVNGVKGPTVYKAFGQIIPSLVTIGAIDCCARGVHAYFQGSIDEVVVFDGALSDQHIQQLYQGGSGGPGPGLDPLFADPNGGDYHLKSERGRYWPEHDIWVLDKVTSPCIDAGDPADDYSAEPAPNGSRINAGAYGGTASASRSEWTSSVDINGDGVVDVRDISIIADNWLRGAGPTPPPDDNVPPTPNPMTWASPPSALSATTISMTATTAADESGIQYYFECISGGGHNSDWRDEPTYTDSGLDPNTEYCYRVKARDKSASRNETGWSVTACATTPASAPIMVWVYIDDAGVPGHEGFHGYMSKYETTNAQYCEYLNAARASGDIIVDGTDIRGADGSNSGEDFVGERYYYLAGPGATYNGATNGGAARINWTGSSFTVDSGFEDHPVTYVSWYGSTAFCNYYGWRLPTEWEWQAVADFKGSYIYGCGTSINNSIANYEDSTHPDGTTEVGAFGAYGYGLCDMAGNVWEWMEKRSDEIEPYRSLRGGSWEHDDVVLRCSFRHSHVASVRDNGIGFRVVFSQS